ncbi:IS30 family transposase, partial [Ruoffia sp. FAM 20858]
NGLLREFFPKKTDLARVISQELNQALWLMNNRPRKCLDYQTPLEVFLHELLLIE